MPKLTGQQLCETMPTFMYHAIQMHHFFATNGETIDPDLKDYHNLQFEIPEIVSQGLVEHFVTDIMPQWIIELFGHAQGIDLETLQSDADVLQSIVLAEIDQDTDSVNTSAASEIEAFKAELIENLEFWILFKTTWKVVNETLILEMRRKEQKDQDYYDNLMYEEAPDGSW